MKAYFLETELLLQPLGAAPRLSGLVSGALTAVATAIYVLPVYPRDVASIGDGRVGVARRTFLKNHAKDLVSIDFFVVPSITFQLLLAFVILSHDPSDRGG
jgi:hypothetical protein